MDETTHARAGAAVDDPSCPECAGLGRGEMAELVRLDVAQLNRTVDFAAFEFGPDSEHTHHIGNLVAIYNLAANDFTKCQFPDRTAHGDGFIIDTQCQQRLRIGKDCAKRWLVDAGYLLNRASKVKGLYASQSLLQKKPQELLDLVESIKDAVRKCENFGLRLAEHQPDLHRELARRAVAKGPSRYQVYIAAPAPERDDIEAGRRREDLVRELVGLEVLNARMTTRGVTGLLAELSTLKADVEAAADLRDVAELERLATRQRALQTKATVLARLVDEAKRFFTSGNMTLLMAAAGRRSIEPVTDENYHFSKGGQRYRLGYQGLFRE